MVAPAAAQVRGSSVRGRSVSGWDWSGLVERLIVSHRQIFASGRGPTEPTNSSDVPAGHSPTGKPFSRDALLIAGQIFSPLLPEEVRDLPVPPRGASEEEKLGCEAKFNQRARWRLTLRACPNVDGGHPVSVPVLLGTAAESLVPKDHAAVADGAIGGDGSEVLLRGDPDGDAGGAALVAVHHLRHDGVACQHGPAAGGRVSELGPQGAFGDLSRGFFRVLGLVKTTLLLGFTLAAYNLDRVRSFKAKHSLDDNGQVVEKPKRQRARRRSGAWTEIVESGPAPPPT
jgi:hypothetical protein